jgi:hypothetical protein
MFREVMVHFEKPLKLSGRNVDFSSKKVAHGITLKD